MHFKKKKIKENLSIIKEFIKNNVVEIYTIIITISILSAICILLNWILKKNEELLEKKINQKNLNILQDSYLKKKFKNNSDNFSEEKVSFLKNKFIKENNYLEQNSEFKKKSKNQNNFFDINETTILLDKRKNKDKMNSDFFGSFIIDKSFFENDLTLKFSDSMKNKKNYITVSTKDLLMFKEYGDTSNIKIL